MSGPDFLSESDTMYAYGARATWNVMLSEAKHLSSDSARFLAAPVMTMVNIARSK